MAVSTIKRQINNLIQGVLIPNNSDINNYTTPGKYYVGSTANAQTLLNAPFSNAFSIEVLIYGQDWIHQRAYKAVGLDKKERYYDYSTSSWTQWTAI